MDLNTTKPVFWSEHAADVLYRKDSTLKITLDSEDTRAVTKI